MNILVTYATKHGSTAEIARVIARDLREAGFEVEVQEVDHVTSLEAVDAVVLGSAIYVGQWQGAALRFIDRFEEQLKARSVWLFSSGPIGDDPKPVEEPPATSDLLARTGALEHQSFTGKLDRSHLGFGDRLIASVVRAPEGDFRDWDAIRGWAVHIARQLRESPMRVPVES
jgi:menaquinone-dependent protoporphyrinogen oxidase